MSVKYLLDGYNAIHQIPQAIGQTTIRAARESLIGYLERAHYLGSPKNRMTVVFDGQPGLSSLPRASAVRMVFSSGETADALILRMVEEEKNKKSLYVITDDRALREGVRALGAKVLGIKDFFGKMDNKRRPVSADKGAENGKDIPKTTEYQINDEMKKIWIG